MNTPNWMTEASAHAPMRAKLARHNRRSTDHSGLTVDVMLAFAAMLVTTWVVYELTSLMLH
jgi:hypothetical protein